MPRKRGETPGPSPEVKKVLALVDIEPNFSFDEEWKRDLPPDITILVEEAYAGLESALKNWQTNNNDPKNLESALAYISQIENYLSDMVSQAGRDEDGDLEVAVNKELDMKNHLSGITAFIEREAKKVV